MLRDAPLVSNDPSQNGWKSPVAASFLRARCGSVGKTTEVAGAGAGACGERIFFGAEPWSRTRKNAMSCARASACEAISSAVEDSSSAAEAFRCVT